jgi:GDPmannose 4,6-dehydratase
MQHSEPDDFVISTMQTHSVRDLCAYVFSKLGLDYRNYVAQDTKFLRPEELKFLKGDSSRAREVLEWEPEYTFETLLDDMVDSYLKKLGGK